jgi:ATP/ADP translocase
MARVGGFAPNKYNKKEEDTEDVTTRENSMPLASAISTPTQSATSKGVYTAVEQSAKSPSTSVKYNNGNMFQQANALFQRVPVLGALFLEVVVSQCLSSLVNFIYLYKLKSTITDDSRRAGWSGNFYAWINGISGVFQFFAIPILLRHCEAHRIWIFMPSLMLCCTMYTWATHSSNGLFGASASFFAIKTMEYSLRVAANESLYVSLDYESRYLGKKVISLGAGKFGKSIMAVALSLVMVIYGERKDVNIMWYLSATATLFTFLWLFTSMRLHSLVEADN